MTHKQFFHYLINIIWFEAYDPGICHNFFLMGAYVVTQTIEQYQHSHRHQLMKESFMEYRQLRQRLE